MKTNSKYLLGILFLGLSLSACKDDDDDDNTVTPHTHTASTITHNQSEFMTMMHAMSANMDTMTMTMDPDHDFAMMMIEHHMGATEMADKEIATGDNAYIKNMATKMKAAQSMEIMELDSIMMAHQATGHSMEAMAKYEAAMDKMDTDADKAILTGDPDHDFASLIIPHHQSAIEMAQAEIQYGANAGLKAMAQKMITDQQKEINDLREWLKTN